MTEWLKEDENQLVFKDFVKTNYAIDTALNNFDSTEVRKQLSERIRKENNVFYKRRFSSYYKYAAILIVALGGFYFYKNSTTAIQSKQNVIIPREDEIVLQLGDESQNLDPNEARTITDKDGNVIGKQEKDRLVYTKAKSADDIMQEVFDAALSTGLFTASEIKVRINPFSYYNNGNTLDDFIHVFSYIMEGRNDDQKGNLSKVIVTKLNSLLPQVPVISINIQDFEKLNYFNKTMI